MPMRRAIWTVLLSGALPHLVAILGCSQPPAFIDGGILEPGVEESGTLTEGQTVRYTVEAQGSHHYAVSVVASAGTLGLPDFRLTASGEPLEKEKSADLFGILRPQATTSFFTIASGSVRLSVRNRTEGLAVSGGAVDFLIGDLTSANYRILVEDLGLDDHGQTPEEATPLSTDGSSVEGSLVVPEDWDYFVFPALEGIRYEVVLEASGNAQLTTGEIDRFDDFVSGTVGEIQFSVRASSGSPGITEFTASSDEDVLLGLRAGADTLLGGIIGRPPGFESFPVRYAVTVREIEPSGGPFPRP